MRYYSKSRVETGLTCQRKRWWAYEAGGTGYTWPATSLPLTIGTVVHDALGGIAEGHDVEDVALAAREEMLSTLSHSSTAPEQAALVEGLVRGFVRHVWPFYQTQFTEVVAVEKMLEYKQSPNLTFLCKPDLLVRDADGNLHYIEYKTTSSIKGSWFNSWQTAIQLHSAAKVVKEVLNEDLTSIHVQGLYKGYSSYGKQGSPFCYGYCMEGQPPLSSDQWSYEYRGGFYRRPTWEMSGGVKGWVEGMPRNVLAKQFPLTPAIFPDHDLIDAFFRQCEAREKEISEATNIDLTFRQNFSQCSPAFGFDCQYMELCHGQQHPIDAGFERREPHHEAERKELE